MRRSHSLRRRTVGPLRRCARTCVTEGSFGESSGLSLGSDRMSTGLKSGENISRQRVVSVGTFFLDLTNTPRLLLPRKTDHVSGGAKCHNPRNSTYVVKMRAAFAGMVNWRVEDNEGKRLPAVDNRRKVAYLSKPEDSSPHFAPTLLTDPCRFPPRKATPQVYRATNKPTSQTS
jgi:hypothetical protein